MAIARIVATLVTGAVMVVGGVVVATAGPPPVVLLGAVTAAVGIGSTLAGLLAERQLAALPRPAASRRVPAPELEATDDDRVVCGGRDVLHSAAP